MHQFARSGLHGKQTVVEKLFLQIAFQKFNFLVLPGGSEATNLQILERSVDWWCQNGLGGPGTCFNRVILVWDWGIWTEVQNLGLRFQDSKNRKYPKIPFLRVRKKWIPGFIGDQSCMGFVGPRKLSKMRIVSGLYLVGKVLFESHRKCDFWLSDNYT